jgi:hypothetical protein
MIRRLFSLGFLSTFIVCSALTFARAQDEAPSGEEGGSKGDPLYGYIATGVLGCLAVFAICKSARR